MPLASLSIAAPPFIACAGREPLWTSPRPADPPTGAQVVGHGREVLALVELGPVPSGRGRLRRSGPPRPGTDRPAGHGKADLSLDPLHAMQFRTVPMVQVSAACVAQRPPRSDRDLPLHTASDRSLWHAGGTAGENNDGPTWRRRLPSRPGVRPILGDHASWQEPGGLTAAGWET